MQSRRWLRILLLIVLAVCLVLVVRFEWEPLKNYFGNWSSLTLFIVAIGIALVLPLPLPVFTRIRKWLADTIGEGLPVQRPRFRFIPPALFALPFTFYVLLSGVQKFSTPVTDFSLIVVAPTLGGLVLTAAGNKRIRRITRIELISVAQKLIVAAVLLIVFTSLRFSIDLIGGIDLNTIDWSIVNVIRWTFFWGAVLSFYLGISLFLVGIFDLVFALRHLRR